MINIIVQQVSSHNPIAVSLFGVLEGDKTDIDLFPPIRAAVGVRERVFCYRHRCPNASLSKNCRSDVHNIITPV